MMNSVKASASDCDNGEHPKIVRLAPKHLKAAIQANTFENLQEFAWQVKNLYDFYKM